jgi:Ca2+/Na+ antiporter
MSNALQKTEKSESLDKSDISQAITSIALSTDSYWQRVRKSIRLQMSEYVKRDFLYSVVGAAFLGLLSVIDGKVTLTTLYLSIVGFCAAFVLRFLKHSVETFEALDRSVKRELSKTKNQLTKLTEDRLQVDIDLRNTKVCIEQTKSALRILGYVTLRFENKDIDALFTKGFKVTLHRHGIVDVRQASDIFAWFGIIRVSSQGTDIGRDTFDRMRIAGHDVTHLYLANLY